MFMFKKYSVLLSRCFKKVGPIAIVNLPREKWRNGVYNIEIQHKTPYYQIRDFLITELKYLLKSKCHS